MFTALVTLVCMDYVTGWARHGPAWTVIIGRFGRQRGIAKKVGVYVVVAKVQHSGPSSAA